MNTHEKWKYGNTTQTRPGETQLKRTIFWCKILLISKYYLNNLIDNLNYWIIISKDRFYI
jgi:hypothetical protein